MGMFYDGRLAAVGYPQVPDARHPLGGVLEASTIGPVVVFEAELVLRIRHG